MPHQVSAREAVGRAARQAPNAWRVLALLAVANLLNFYDRTVPAIVVEPIKAEFGLTDLQIGLLSASFTVVYALAGIALGRLADRVARRKVMAWGLITWSLFTAAGGGAWSFASLLLFRIGVGVGEASYAPAANSLIADLFPAHKRSRAVAVFQFGLPLGLVLSFFTTGAIVEAFGSWRAPFVVAAIPGLLVGVALFFIREPERGAAEERATASTEVTRPIRALLRIPTLWWLVVSGIGLQVGAYAAATFLVPLFQRYFGMSLTAAAVNTGVAMGVSGVLGLLLGGASADRASRKSRRGRLLVAVVALAVAAPLTFWALSLPNTEPVLFLVVFSLGWLLQFSFHTSALPTVSDVVEPRLRSTAIALFFAAFYLLGGAFGPIVAGALSDHYAATATEIPPGLTAEAVGLHDSLLVLVPASLLVAALGMLGAARTVDRDHRDATPAHDAPGTSGEDPGADTSTGWSDMATFPFRNDGAAAVVTGAASGIGAATALELARRGANLALVDIAEDGLIEVAAQARDLGVRVSTHAVDITDVAAVAALADAVAAEHGGAHVLVNSAGVSLLGYFEQLTLEEFRWLLDVNLWGTIAVTKTFLPLLMAQPAAHISNLSSAYGLIAPAGRAPYATSKFAVRGFTESLLHELEDTGVSVSVVFPGGVKTQIALKARVAAAVPPERAAAAARAQTEKYRTTPEEAARVIVDGIAARKPRVLVGNDARMLDRLARVAPVRYWKAIRGAMAASTDTTDRRDAVAEEKVSH
ncbi:MFS transporter [Saccharothrix hoggarensis]|uniref:MFS transporter n=1 Tax=Saccharothrix hoggarensis TaxID=913853 RepID=A0ABW3QW05_9PSEU